MEPFKSRSREAGKGLRTGDPFTAHDAAGVFRFSGRPGLPEEPAGSGSRRRARVAPEGREEEDCRSTARTS